MRNNRSGGITKKTAARHARAEEIRRKAEVVFAQLTERIKAEALDKIVAEGSVYERAEPILETIDALYRNILLDKPSYRCFTEKEFFALGEFLALRVTAVYDNYELRKDLTDEELLACDAKKGNVDDPEKYMSLRNTSATKNFATFVDNDWRYFSAVVSNLRTYVTLCAHRAKDLGSFRAARPFMAVNNLLARRVVSSGSFIREGEPERVLENLREGHDELWMAFDYAVMKPWAEVLDNARRRLEELDRKTAEDVPGGAS